MLNCREYVRHENANRDNQDHREPNERSDHLTDTRGSINLNLSWANHACSFKAIAMNPVHTNSKSNTDEKEREKADVRGG